MSENHFNRIRLISFMGSIFISVCGEGFGHSSRSIAVAEQIKKMNNNVVLASYNNVYKRLKSDGRFKVVRAERELILEGKGGSLYLGESILKTITALMAKNRELIKTEENVIKKSRAKCVISDSRFSTLIASSYNLGLPTIYIANQLKMPDKYLKEKRMRLLKKPIETLTKIAYLLADKIIIPDFPPPITISRNLISFESHITKKIEFVGPVVSERLFSIKKNSHTSRKMILVLTGGFGFEDPIISMIRKIGKIRDYKFIVISKQIKRKEQYKNIELLPFVKDVYQYMKSADLIISHAGHSTIMEAITLGTNLIVIPFENHFEQEENARSIEKLKLGKVFRIKKHGEEKLVSIIDEILSDSEYRKNAKKLSKLSRKMRGAERVARLSIKYAEKIDQFKK